jgi:CHAT domain-containing protein
VLERAEASLAAARSPFAGWVRLDQAICAYFEKDFIHADSLLSTLRRDAEASSFLALQGRAEWILGLIRMVQARFVDADRHYAAAIDLFSRLGEGAHVVYLRSLRAKEYEYGGALREAWRERLAALAGRQIVTDPERLYTIFEGAAQAMRRRGHYAAALGFLSEQMRAAEMETRQKGDGDLLAFTLIARADLLAEIGHPSEAAVDLARAQDVWKRLPPDNESRRRLRVDLDAQLASLSEGSAARTAVMAVDRAMAFFDGTTRSLGDQIEILRLRQLRAKVHLRQGKLAEARNDLREGIAEVERQRLEVAEMEDRARFLTAERGLFMDLLRLELEHFQDHAAALEVLERSSNRVFGDLATAHADLVRTLPPSHWAEALKASLPSRTLVIRYGHLSDRLLIWTFLNGRMDFEERTVAEAELRSRVVRCRNLLTARFAAPDEREEVCNEAASILLPRSLQSLPEGYSVLIVADELVSALPLAGLRAYPGGPHLVERYSLSYSPNLESWLIQPTEQSAPQPEIRSALFISDPAFSRHLFPTLRSLVAARRAPESLASYYPRAERLAGPRATKAAVLASMDRSEVLHFDGHGITNSQYPERGGLLLAPADPAAPDIASSLLTAADLPPRALKHLRLVILGACSTGLTSYQDTAEVTGLAAAFLARGVPAVIGTAWDVPDEGASRLLEQLHRELAEGERPEKALQEAQRVILHSNLGEADTRTWAAFQVFLHGKHGTRSVYVQ